MGKRVPHNKKWYREAILLEAKKYSNATEWMNNSLGSYLAARRTGVMAEASRHFERLNTQWTKEKILKEAKNYRTRGAWKNSGHGSYRAAIRMGLMSSATKHMKPPPRIWTKQDIFKEVKKYSSIGEWHKKSPGSLSASRRFGIYVAVSKHIKRKLRKWTNEDLIADAKKYKTRSEWQRSGTAYTIARNRGILHTACSHMRVVGNKYKRMIYAIENPDHSVYVGLSKDPWRRYEDHISERSKQKCDPIIRAHYLGGRQILKVIEKLHLNAQAKIEEGALIEKYRAEGWTVLNSARAGALGSTDRIYTLSTCMALARLVTSRTEYSEKYPSAYNAVCRRRWARKVFANIPSKVPERYTKRAVTEAAKRCKTRAEFMRRFNRHYNAASRMRILDKITQHMGRGKTHRIADTKLLRAAESCRTIMEFQSKFPREYGVARSRGIEYFKRIAGHLKAARLKVSTERAFEEMGMCKTRYEFTVKYKSSYKFILKNYPAELNRALPMKKRMLKWDLESCKADAAMWPTEKEWRDNSSGAYTAARKHGWLNFCCAHMVVRKRRNGTLTLAFCVKDAQKYRTRMEWRRASQSVYKKAHENGWLDECCKHMVSGRFKAA